jgi:trimeric autotransporter adhesin
LGEGFRFEKSKSPRVFVLKTLPRLFLSVSALVLFSSLPAANANNSNNSGVTYHGRILKPNGAPLEGQLVMFKLQIRTPSSGQCLMYEEVQTRDMRNSSGVFAITLNDTSGIRSDENLIPFDRVFANQGSFQFNASDCLGTGSTYTPNPGDARKFYVSFKDETMSAWETLPAQTINYVPLAIEANQVGGFPAASLLRVVNGQEPGTISPLSTTDYSKLVSLILGTSTQYAKANQLNGTPLPTLSAGQSIVWTGTAWEAYSPGTFAETDPTVMPFAKSSLPSCLAGQSLTTNGSGFSCVTNPATGVTSITAGTGLDGGTITTAGTISIANQGVTSDKIADGAVTAAKLADSPVTPNTYTKVTVSEKGLVTSGSSLIQSDIPDLNWSKILSTPTSLTGYGIIDGVQNAGGIISIQSGIFDDRPSAALVGRVYIATDSKEIFRDNGTTWDLISTRDAAQLVGMLELDQLPIVPVTKGGTGLATAPSNGQILIGNGTGFMLNTLTGGPGVTITNSAGGIQINATGSGGTVTAVSALPPIVVATGTTTPQISLASGGSSGDVLIWDGSEWASGRYRSLDLVTSSGSSAMPAATCGTNQFLSFNSVSGQISCVTIQDASGSAKGLVQIDTTRGLQVASGVVGLENSGATAGDYTKVTVDAMGRVTAGANLESSDVTTALGYTPVNKTGDTMTGALNLPSNGLTVGTSQLVVSGGNVGIGTATPVTKLDVAGGIRVGSEAAACAAGLTGAIRYNTGNLEYCNGSAWTALAASGSGITAFNGQTGNTQTFATPGVSGTAPNWISGSDTHTLNIPMASGTDVTAGLISKTDYDSFSGKLSSVSGSALSNGQMWVGDSSNQAAAVTMSGDATLSNAGALSLSTTGVSAGTYPKVTVDAKGRVTTGTSLVASDIPDLDWSKITSGTPSTLSGYGITDGVLNAGGTPSVQTGLVSARPEFGTLGRLYLASDERKLYRDTGTAWELVTSLDAADLTGTLAEARLPIVPISKGGTGLSAAGTANQILGVNGAGSALEYKSVTAGTGVSISQSAGGIEISATGSGGTVTNVTGTAPINVATGTTTPVISLASGSVDGQALVWNGSSWGSAMVKIADIRNTSGVSPLPASSCGTNQFMAWTSATDSFSCVTIQDASDSAKGLVQIDTTRGMQVTSGVVGLANSGATAGDYTKVTVDAMGRVTAGASLESSDVTTALGYTPVNKTGDTMTGALNLPSNGLTVGTSQLVVSGGNIGIGTTSPATKLDVAGGIRVGSEAAVCAAGLTGAIRYNTGNLEYCNGSAWTALAASGAGITAFNGQTGNTQTFATPGVSGTAPNWISGSDAHTLNIPMASTASVTAGLISKADYDTFNGKLSAITGSSLTSGQIWIGDGSNQAAAVTMSGDATLSNAGALSLSTTGVGAGTYPKVSVDAKGRVTAGTSLVASDIPDLDWSKITSGTPTTLSGYGITDGVLNAGGTPSVQTGLVSARPEFGTVGRLYLASDERKLYRDTGTAWELVTSLDAADLTGTLAEARLPIVPTSKGGTGLSSAGTANQILGVNGAGSALEYKSVTAGTGVSISQSAGGIEISATGSGGTVTNVTGTAPINVATGTTTPVISLASGSVDGQGLIWNGTSWGPAMVRIADIRNTAGVSPLPASSCGINQFMAWTSATDSFSCVTIQDASDSAKGLVQIDTTRGLQVTSGVVGLANSGATAGDYTKVTVDAMGRVTAGASLASSDVTTALGYTPVNKTGDTMTGALNLPSNGLTVGTSQLVVSGGNVGIGTATPVTKLDVAGGIRVGSETALCASGLAGGIRFNGGNLEYCNGANWTTLAASGSGITSLNGETGNTQSFGTPGTTGTAPGWSSAAGVHTLNIPMASTASVTAGLISKADYDTFNGKLSAVAGSSLTSGQVWIGDGSNQAAAVAISGDATLSNTGALALSASGVTAGTYPKVTVDAKGRVTAGNSLLESDIPNLSWNKITSGTPTTLSGYGITDGVLNAGGTPSLQTGLISARPEFGTLGRLYLASDERKLYRDTGTAWVLVTSLDAADLTGTLAEARLPIVPISKGGTGLSSAGTANQILGVNGAGSALEYKSVTAGTGVSITPSAGGIEISATGSGGTVTNVTGTAPINVATGTTTPVISIASGSASGQTLVWNGSSWAAAKYRSLDLVNSTNGSALPGSDCTENQFLVFNSVTGQFTCQSIQDASGTAKGLVQVDTTRGLQVASGVIGLANSGTTAGSYSKVTVDVMGRVTAGASLESSDVTTALGYTPVNKTGDTMTGALNLPSNGLTVGTSQLVVSGGNVGIGTASPATKLDVAGGIRVGSEAAACAAGLTGAIRYNTGNLEYCNGSAWTALAASGSGIVSFNGETGSSQTFATPGTSGNAPAWTSTSNTHTLNIPMASVTGVTAGLISKTEYDAFNGKLSAVTGSSLTSGQMWVGNSSNQAAAVVMSGDATLSNTGALTLATSGVTVGTYPKVTVDAKGRVTAGTTLVATDIPALDWSKITSGTPTTLSGYGITDGVQNAGGTPSVQTGLISARPAFGTAGRLYLASDERKLYRDTGTAWQLIASVDAADLTGTLSDARLPIVPTSKGGTGLSSAGTANQILGVNGAGSALEYKSVTAGTGVTITPSAGGIEISATSAGGTVTNVTGSAPINVATGTTTPVISIASGSASGQTLVWNGSSWAAAKYRSLDLVNSSNGSALPASDCTVNQFLVFNSVTGQFTCQSIQDASGTAKGLVQVDTTRGLQVASGVLSLANSGATAGTYSKVTVDVMGRVTAGANLEPSDFTTALGYTPVNKTGDTMTGALNLPSNGLTIGTSELVVSGGNVGIGTSTPTSLLQLSASTPQIRFATPSTGGTTADGFVVGIDNSNGNALVWNHEGSPIRFGTSNIERMVITQPGNVGIGSTTPVTRLDVAGGVRVGTETATCAPGLSGTIRLNGSALEFCNGTAWTSLGGGSITFPLLSTTGGTAAAPAYSFSGDTNNGIFSPGADILAVATAGAERMRIDVSGNVGIGTTAPTQKLHVAGSILSDAYLYTSDRRLKTDIRDIEGLETILALRGVKFRWKKDGSIDLGLIAQEVEAVAPDLVVTDPVSGLKSVKYGNLVAPLIEATKDLYGMCEAVSTQVSIHEREIAALKADLEALKAESARQAQRNKALESEVSSLREDLDQIKSLLRQTLGK